MRRRPDEAEREPSRGAGRDGSDGGSGTLGRRQRATGLRHERPARRGELDVPPVALEELGAELSLESPHLLGERRLRDPQPRGSATEVELLGHGEKRPQVAELYETSIDLQMLHNWYWKISPVAPTVCL